MRSWKRRWGFGGLDIAFNNAGTLGAVGATTEVATQAWRDTVDTNLTSAFLGAKHQLPAMLNRGGGSIVFTSSFVGHRWSAADGRVRRQQVRSDWSDTGACGRVRATRHSRECTATRRHRYPYGTNGREHPRSDGVRLWPARHETHRRSRGDCPIGPRPCLRCVELYDGYGAARRWWCLDQSNLNPLRRMRVQRDR